MYTVYITNAQLILCKLVLGRAITTHVAHSQQVVRRARWTQSPLCVYVCVRRACVYISYYYYYYIYDTSLEHSILYITHINIIYIQVDRYIMPPLQLFTVSICRRRHRRVCVYSQADLKTVQVGIYCRRRLQLPTLLAVLLVHTYM